MTFSGHIHRTLRRAASKADRFAPATISMPLLAWSERQCEEPEARLLPVLTSRKNVAVDVGAANGGYSYYLAGLARECHAFEPNPQSVALLRRRLPNVHVYNVALSNRSGTAILRVPTVNGLALRGWGSIEVANRFETLPRHDVDTFEVETAPLDSFGFREVGIIKIDVEGHELNVLQGALGVIERDRPFILVEAEDRHRAGALVSVCDLLGPFGYSAWYLRDKRVHPVDWHNTDETAHVRQSHGDQKTRNFLLLCRERLQPDSVLANLLSQSSTCGGELNAPGRQR